jgi:hypothetical protein
VRADDRLAADDADCRQVGGLRERPIPGIASVWVVRRDPAERDLVAVEEEPEISAAHVPPMAEDNRAWRRRLRGEALKAVQPGHPVCGKSPDLAHEVGCCRRNGVVVVRLDAHDPRRLGGAEADREDRAEDHRDLAEDVARMPDADGTRNSVNVLDRLDLARQHREQRAFAALVGSVLAGSEADVCRNSRKPLAVRGIQAREEGDLRDLLGRDHRPTLPHSTRASQAALLSSPYVKG